MTSCFFVSDLHGNTDRYEKLFRAISDEHPAAVFLGGDLVPHYMAPQHLDFATDYLAANFRTLQERMGDSYPRVFLILGNDDGRHQEQDFLDAASQGIWEYAHNRKLAFGNYTVYGYSYVPPTPFMLKDWERYDVSRYVDPGCVSPEEGHRSIPISAEEAKYGTIQQDLEKLAGAEDLSRSIFLFHTPPYRTELDRAALDGKMFDHVPLDVNIGSIAVRRFIKAHQPLLTLHGHVHESARLTGSWRDQIGETPAFSAAHDGPELALVHFDPTDLSRATRRLF